MWLAWAFQQFYHSVVSLHEPGVMLKDLAFQYYHDTVDSLDAADAVHSARLPAIEAARLYMKKTHYIEVNRNLFSLADLLQYSLRSKYVTVSIKGLVGDGRVFVRSMTNKGAYVQHRPYGWFVPKDHPDWDSYSQIKKISWHWVEKVRLVLKSSEFVYRIEDLTSSRRCWNSLAKSLGLPLIRSQSKYDLVSSVKQNHVPCNVYTRFSDISSKDQRTFWDIAGNTMKELNYIQ